MLHCHSAMLQQCHAVMLEQACATAAVQLIDVALSASRGSLNVTCRPVCPSPTPPPPREEAPYTCSGGSMGEALA